MAVAAAPGAQERRDARVDQRRKRVADAALYLFAARGYNVTSVDDIVARSKTSKSAFYEFFKSKEDCFRDVLLQEGGALIHEVTGMRHEVLQAKRGTPSQLRCE